GDLFGKGLRLGEHILGSDRSRKKADSLGFIAQNKSAREKQLRRLGDADEARKEIADAESAMKPDAREIRSVFGLAISDADVGEKREPEAAADGMPIERADYGDLEIEDAEKGRVHPITPLVGKPAFALALNARVEIRSGAEAAPPTREDQHTKLAIRFDLG